MSLQTELNIMDQYRTYVTSQERKKEQEIILMEEFFTKNRSRPKSDLIR